MAWLIRQTSLLVIWSYRMTWFIIDLGGVIVDNHMLMPILLRFLLGGGAIVLCTLIARSFGSRIGGIFAAFPAVYLAALLSLKLDYQGGQLIEMSIHVSEGALVGMLANIICAVAASYLVLKKGWQKGLGQALLIWLVAATCIYITWKLVMV